MLRTEVVHRSFPDSTGCTVKRLHSYDRRDMVISEDCRKCQLRLGAVVGLLIALAVGGCQGELARQVSKYEKTRDFDSAEQLLERTVRQDPGNAEAHFLLGRVHMRQGEYQEGVNAFKKSRETSARYVEKIDFLTEKYAHEEFREGKSASESGSPREAARHFRNVTTIEPSNAKAFRALGHALVQSGRPSEAEEAYLSALDLEPNSLEVLNNLSALTYRQGAYAETIRYSKRALELEETEGEVVKRLAYAYLETDQFSGAREQFERALKVAPATELRRDYALALYNREEHKEALPHLRQLAGVEEPGKPILHALGDTYLALERYREAADTYLRIRENSPDDESAIQGLLISYKEMGDTEKVEQYRGELEGID